MGFILGFVKGAVASGALEPLVKYIGREVVEALAPLLSVNVKFEDFLSKLGIKGAKRYLLEKLVRAQLEDMAKSSSEIAYALKMNDQYAKSVLDGVTDEEIDAVMSQLYSLVRSKIAK